MNLAVLTLSLLTVIMLAFTTCADQPAHPSSLIMICTVCFQLHVHSKYIWLLVSELKNGEIHFRNLAG